MALDFTSIKDYHGCAVVFIHDGTSHDHSAFLKLLEDTQKRTTKQCTLLSIKDVDAQSILRFYSLQGSHFVLLIGDDDQLHHVWADGERFDASTIAYTAEQIG